RFRVRLNRRIKLLHRPVRVVLCEVKSAKGQARGHIGSVDFRRLGEHLTRGLLVTTQRLNLPHEQVDLGSLRRQSLGGVRRRQRLVESAQKKESLTSLDLVLGRLLQRLGERVKLSKRVLRTLRPRVGDAEAESRWHIVGELSLDLFELGNG